MADIPLWKDQRLAQASVLIEQVMDELHFEDDIHILLKKALDAVEDADVELEKRT